jgi:hypothetical protein
MSKKSEKSRYVTEETFERSMLAIAQSFNGIHEHLAVHDGMFEILINEVRAIREDTKDMRGTLHDLNMHLVRHERRLDDHTERIEKLETKLI